MGGFLIDKVAALLLASGTLPAPWSEIEVVDLVEVGVFTSYVMAAILGLVMVREIQARADFRAHALGLDAPLAAMTVAPGSTWAAPSVAPAWPGAVAPAPYSTPQASPPTHTPEGPVPAPAPMPTQAAGPTQAADAPPTQAPVPAPAPVTAQVSVPTPTSASEALRSLNELRDQGLVTDDEYAAKRAEILGRL